MAFVFEGLLGATLTLTVVYFLLMFFAGRKLLWLQVQSSTGLNTRKLFVATCLLTSALRFMSFGSMAMLDLGRVHFEEDNGTGHDDDGSGTGNFFEKASLVLFDFPDFCCVSGYVLLIVIWAETYLKSRRHWLSPLRFRKAWMFGYFIFNIVLYMTQLALYSLLFLPSVDKNVEMNLIYLTLASFNIILPIVWLLSYLYLAMIFSGFPFSTPMDKFRLKVLSRLGLVWTVARFAWGLIALTSVLQGWLTQAKRSKLFYTIVLIGIFLCVEVVPICFSLQERVLQSLSEREVMALVMTSHVSDSNAHNNNNNNNNNNNSITLSATHNKSSAVGPHTALLYHSRLPTASATYGGMQADSRERVLSSDIIDEESFIADEDTVNVHFDTTFTHSPTRSPAPQNKAHGSDLHSHNRAHQKAATVATSTPSAAPATASSYSFLTSPFSTATRSTNDMGNTSSSRTTPPPNRPGTTVNSHGVTVYDSWLQHGTSFSTAVSPIPASPSSPIAISTSPRTPHQQPTSQAGSLESRESFFTASSGGDQQGLFSRTSSYTSMRDSNVSHAQGETQEGGSLWKSFWG